MRDESNWWSNSPQEPGRSPIVLGDSGAKTANAIGLLPHDGEPLRKPDLVFGFAIFEVVLYHCET